MPLHLFNTLTKRKEEFVPIEEGKVRFYTCGPTVYGRPHIGNYASFLMADLLRRWLEVSGYSVIHVKNITDVGHLTADAVADAGGEDKVEKQARLEKARGDQSLAPGFSPGTRPKAEVNEEDVMAIARKYEEQYLEDERALNMLEPHVRPRATETIPEMIALIERLIKAGHAYETGDGVYFSVERFGDYGKLSGNTLANLGKLQPSPRLRLAGQEGVRIGLKETKKHPADFALWKKRVGEHRGHVLHWDSPWGDGFPGWHIECSAMSLKFLCPAGTVPGGTVPPVPEGTVPAVPGGTGTGWMIDIHTGGEDNIFPHHECEIAQSEAAAGRRFVRCWLHKRRVNFAREKMSKSLGNVLTLPEVVAKGFSPLDLRYFLLSGHYRSHTQFTWKGLEDARRARLKVSEWMEERLAAGFSPQTAPQAKDNEVRQLHQRFTDAMNDDLNAPEALAAVFDCMAASRNQKPRHHRGCGAPSEIRNQKSFFDMPERVFGCFAPEAFTVPDDVQGLVAEREEARGAGDFARGDRLRALVRERGFVIEDLPGGPKVVPTGWR